MKSATGIARRLALGMLFSVCAASVWPQNANVFNVEIVVFRSGGDGGALPDTTAPGTTGEDVEVTPVATGKLNSAAGKLRARSSGFRVLGHAAWNQAPTGFNSRRGVSTRQLGLGEGISGRIFLERGQFLNLRMDLTIEDGGRRYRISELRRNVKTGQIHYFDHPAVGVLAIVSPASGG